VSTFLKSQIRDSVKQSIFFSEIRRVRFQQIQLSRESYRWGKPDYKLYPSALSYDMCPVRYLLSLENWNGIANLDAIYRVRAGSAKHEELQRDFLTSGKAYPIQLDNVTNPRILTKIKDNPVEVPFHGEINRSQWKLNPPL
jgi:hypothetical protein